MAKAGYITENFSWAEFNPEKVDIGIYGDLMVVTLAKSLQKLRDKLNEKFKSRLVGTEYKEIGIRITSAVRGAGDYNRLVAKGYKPSITSDHNYGQPIRIPKDFDTKRAVSGEYYSLSAGAVDFQLTVPQGIVSLKEVVRTVTDLAVAGEVDVGQVLLEKQGEKEWVHIGNNLLSIIKQYIAACKPANGKFSVKEITV